MARIALYSHDSTGLGHVRRNLAVAEALTDVGHDVLLVAGSPEAAAMPRPPSSDLVTLPALAKDVDGRYHARHLHLAVDDLCRLRRDILTSALRGFAPDLLVVDRHPRGFLGELEPALEQLPGTRVVLGLRDVIDHPDRVRAEWRDQQLPQALERWYDEVWIYGDPELHHPLDAARVGSPVPVVPLGYLAAERRGAGVPDPALPAERSVLCTVGGGADGVALAELVLRTRLPEGLGVIVVSGPQMPAADHRRLERLAAARPDARHLTYLRDPSAVLRRARAAVVMGGYNTVCEVLASETPTLVVPRVRPRLEQAVRAEALARAGLLDMVHPDRAAAQLPGWLAAAVSRPRQPREHVDRDGMAGVRRRVAELLGRPPRPHLVATRPRRTERRVDVAVEAAAGTRSASAENRSEPTDVPIPDRGSDRVAV